MEENKLFSDLESRVVDIHFDDLEKFIHDESIASSIEGLYESVCENKIVNLSLSKDFLDATQNWSKAETMYYFAKFLTKKGGCVVEIQTPIPSKIKKDESGVIRGWASCGFGLCRVTRLYIDNLANMAQRIDEFERALFEEIYQKEQQKSAMQCKNIDDFSEVKNGLTVEQIMKTLSQYQKDLPVKIMVNNELYSSDFNTYSWRGSFSIPAIQYDEYNATTYLVETAIVNLKETHQKEVTGYKGGEYKLSLQDVLYIANCDTAGNDTAVVGIREQNGTVILFTRPGMY